MCVTHCAKAWQTRLKSCLAPTPRFGLRENPQTQRASAFTYLGCHQICIAYIENNENLVCWFVLGCGYLGLEPCWKVFFLFLKFSSSVFSNPYWQRKLYRKAVQQRLSFPFRTLLGVKCSSFVRGMYLLGLNNKQLFLAWWINQLNEFCWQREQFPQWCKGPCAAVWLSPSISFIILLWHGKCSVNAQRHWAWSIYVSCSLNESAKALIPCIDLSVWQMASLPHTQARLLRGGMMPQCKQRSQSAL